MTAEFPEIQERGARRDRGYEAAALAECRYRATYEAAALTECRYRATRRRRSQSAATGYEAESLWDSTGDP
jgi:hypothetical protein